MLAGRGGIEILIKHGGTSPVHTRRPSQHRRLAIWLILTVVLVFAEVHPFGSVTAEPITVDIVRA